MPDGVISVCRGLKVAERGAFWGSPWAHKVEQLNAAPSLLLHIRASDPLSLPPISTTYVQEGAGRVGFLGDEERRIRHVSLTADGFIVERDSLLAGRWRGFENWDRTPELLITGI